MLTRLTSTLGAEPNTIIEDDIITIRCSNGSTVEPFIFRIAQSALARSPSFQTFFKSEYYAPQSDMLISFMIDPAAVFDIIKRYLEEGPDRFDLTNLRVHLYRRYTTIERETVLVRLCRMAHNMELAYLCEMAYDVLVDESRFITAPMLPMLAGLIFASRANYHSKIKEWCLVHVGRHFLELRTSRQWANCLRVSEQQLSDEWSVMLEQNEEILYTFENDSDEKVLEKKIHRMSFQEQDRAISVLGEKRTQDDNTADELARSNFRNGPDEEEEWEDLNTPSSGGDTKTAVDGDDEVTVGPATPREGVSRSNSAENAKARHVMGIDCPEIASPSGKKLRRKRGKISSILTVPRSPRPGTGSKGG